MINSRISQWLDSGEYLTEIDNVLTNIVRKSELANSEAETASIFEREIFFLLRERLDFEINISRETTINGIVHSFSTDERSGRIDAIINSLLIE